MHSYRRVKIKNLTEEVSDSIAHFGYTPYSNGKEYEYAILADDGTVFPQGEEYMGTMPSPVEGSEQALYLSGAVPIEKHEYCLWWLLDRIHCVPEIKPPALQLASIKELNKAPGGMSWAR